MNGLSNLAIALPSLHPPLVSSRLPAQSFGHLGFLGILVRFRVSIVLTDWDMTESS